MESFREMSKEELQAQEVEVNKKYQEFKDLHLSLNMARGKPAPDQIDHANGMLETMTDYHAKMVWMCVITEFLMDFQR